MQVFIGADHNGMDLKERLTDVLEEKGYDVTDCGNKKQDAADDYPVFAKSVAEAVAGDKKSRGILICNTGIGMSIAANKFDGVRAARACTVYDAELARTDNDANVICLGANDLLSERARAIAEAFLTTDFSKEERHARRVKLLAEL